MPLDVIQLFIGACAVPAVYAVLVLVLRIFPQLASLPQILSQLKFLQDIVLKLHGNMHCR